MATKEEMLAKIQGLLALAESTGFTEEADTARRKADELMVAYSIEMWEIDKRRKPQERTVAEVRTFDIGLADSVVSVEIRELFAELCHHWRVRPVFYGYYDRKWKKGQTPWRQYAKVVGFPQELDWLELMFTSMRVHIATHMEPQPNPALDFEANLVIMKEAGMKWERIHHLLKPEVPWSRTHGTRYTNMYTDYCNRTGNPRLNIGPVQYQRNFVDGYRAKISTRLYDIRQYRQEAVDRGSGMELMLRDKKTDIDALFNATFTGLTKLKDNRVKFDPGAFTAGSKAGANADLGQSRMGRGPKEIG